MNLAPAERILLDGSVSPLRLGLMLRPMDDDDVQPPRLQRQERHLHPDACDKRHDAVGAMNGNKGPYNPELHEDRIFAVVAAIYQYRISQKVALDMVAAAREESARAVKTSFRRYATTEERTYNPYRDPKHGGRGVDRRMMNRRYLRLAKLVTAARDLPDALRFFACAEKLPYHYSLIRTYASEKVREAIERRWPERYTAKLASYAAA